MDWSDIRLFIEIGRAGSFASAAAVLSVNPATVSRRVATLEAMAGTRLFHRTPVGATLSPAGERLMGAALKVEEDVLDFDSALRKIGRSPQRMISVVASEGVASYLLAPLVAHQRLGPLGIAADDVRPELPCLRLLTNGSSEKADITILWTAPEGLPPGRPDDKIQKLADVRFHPFYSKRYLQYRERLPESFEQLAGHKLITLNNYRWFETEGSMNPWHRMVDASNEGAFATDWTSSVGHLTLDGAGIGLLPTYAPLYSEGLIPLDVATPPMVGVMWMRASNDNLRDPAIRKTFTSLGQLFAAAPW